MHDLERVHARYGPALLRKARRILRSDADAQDVVQTLLVDLWRRDRLRAELPYLYRAITHRCLNHLRDADNRQRLLEQHRDGPGAGVLHGWTALPLEGRVIDRDLLLKLGARLDRRRWEVFVYRHIDEMELEDIAALIGTNRKTVQRWLARVQDEARRLLTEGDDG